MELDRVLPRSTAEVPYMDREGSDFKLILRFTPMDKIDAMRRSCRVRGGTSDDDIDFGKWCTMLAREVVIGWVGLERKGDAVPFSHDILRQMLRNFDFARWLTEKITTMETWMGEFGSDDVHDSGPTASQ